MTAAPSVPSPPARSLRERTLDLIFPPRCVGCRGAGRWICDACWTRVPWLTGPRCARCWRECEDGLCARCSTDSAVATTIRAVAAYDGLARRAVHELKYNGHHNIATVLGPLMAGVLTVDNPVLVPVPLHPVRRRRRGYNQSELLARHAARALGAPVVSDRLQRVRNTADQVKLTAVQRRENVRDAFRWRGPAVSGTPVLVDDVFTTGSRLEACRVALVTAGMHDVWALVFARAALDLPMPLHRATPSTRVAPTT